MAAMLELVGEQGYAPTTVADVIARAGASRRTFYEQFANREACLLAAGDEIAASWLERTAAAVDRANDAGENTTEAFVSGLFEAAVANPGGLRLVATDLPAAGQAGIQRRERLLGELSVTFSRALALSTGTDVKARATSLAGEASLLPHALAGAIVRLFYARMLRGRRVRRTPTGDLLELLPDVTHWATSCWLAPGPPLGSSDAWPAAGGRAPGTLSLTIRGERRRGLPRGEGSFSRSLVVHSQRERLLDAIANLSAAKGYARVTIPQIVREAAVSVEAFYEHFSNREDALLVAYEVGRRKQLALVERAYLANERGPAAIRAGIATLLTFLASEPSFAHLALVDVPAAGGRLATLGEGGAVARLLRAYVQPKRGRARPSEAALDASASAVRELCYMHVVSKRASELTTLADIATHLALMPFAGDNVQTTR